MSEHVCNANRAIRILVDGSRDSEWSGALLNLEPDTIYRITDNRDTLNWDTLKNYDVLTVCGYSPLAHREDELHAIVRFVEGGGGLLLAAHTGRFERDTGLPIEEMAAQKIAERFGITFLSPNAAKAETKWDDALVKGYPREVLRLMKGEASEDIAIDDIPLSYCAPIAIPEDAEVLLAHRETGEPIGATMSFGKGRIAAINDMDFSNRSPRLCRSLMDWLSAGRFSGKEGAEDIPDQIPIAECTRSEGEVTLYYNAFVENRVERCLEFATKIGAEFAQMLPLEKPIQWNIVLVPSCTSSHRHWGDQEVRIGALTSDPMLAYSMGYYMASMRLHRDALGGIFWEAGFGDEAFRRHLGRKAMEVMGFHEEAEAMRAAVEQRYRERDPSGKGFDLARAYEEYHPKGLWAWSKLEEKVGSDLLLRVAKTIPKKDARTTIPHPPFSDTDVLIYYLSLAVNEDLYPWFEEIGTTVHPLPILPKDSDAFKAEVEQRLTDALKDQAGNASDRMDAAFGLIQMQKDRKETLADAAAKLSSADPIVRFVAALRLAHASDARAAGMLRELSEKEEDRMLWAMAALALVQMGDREAAPALCDLARTQDPRFRLDAGYALYKACSERSRRIGFEGWESLLSRSATEPQSTQSTPLSSDSLCDLCEIVGNPLTHLKSEKGEQIGEFKVEYDGFLKIFPVVDGYKVANIFTGFGQGHFPENTHVTRAYVDWVHTGGRYRRKGLSRLTMIETMAHPAVQRCSCAVLGTGTRNVAHALYRSFGFVDTYGNVKWTRDLEGVEGAKVVEGVTIRGTREGDEGAMAELYNRCYAKFANVGKRKATRWPLRLPIKIAERENNIVGYVVSGGIRDEEIRLREVCVQEGDGREDIGRALLCALHNDLRAKGAKTVTWRWGVPEDDFLTGLLHRAGYRSEKGEGVDMFKLIHLPRFLRELSPLIAHRLLESDHKDWHGKISLSGEQHRATLIVEGGKIQVEENAAEDADVRLCGDDAALTRIVAGRQTPFEAYLQLELTIEPKMNDEIRGLVETIFPRIPMG